MKHEEKTEATEVVVDTEPALISDEEAAKAVGGSGGSVIKVRPPRPDSMKTTAL